MKWKETQVKFEDQFGFIKHIQNKDFCLRKKFMRLSKKLTTEVRQCMVLRIKLNISGQLVLRFEIEDTTNHYQLPSLG